MEFRARFLVPVILIALLAIGALSGGLFWLTSLQNRMELEREHAMLSAVVEARVDLMRRNLRDYSIWDDAAQALVIGNDYKWADEQFGTFLFEVNGFETAAVLDASGAPVYASADGHRSKVDVKKRLGGGFERAMRQTLADQAGRAGVSKGVHGPLIFAINKISPSTKGVDVSGRPARFMVTAKLLDDAVLAEFQKAAQGPQLRLLSEGQGGAGALALTAYDGTSAGVFEWMPDRPGSALRQQVLPALFLLSSFLLLLAGRVLWHARQGIREVQASEARAIHLAHHDTLTSLPNRRAFTERLLHLARDNLAYAVMFIDLDGFKEVNDAFGHGTGDALLKRTSERLLSALPVGASLARLGGDEFAITVPRMQQIELTALAERLIACVKRAHDFGGEPIVVGASIGIAESEGREYEDIIRRADVAMYASKLRGRDGWCLYSADLDDGRQERKILEGELRRAIEAGDISVEFQPIVRASDGEIITMEALARWTHPTKGPISPDIFVPIAEETGAIVELGRFVLQEACTAARDWPYNLAVNLSPAQFWDRTLVETVLTTLEECKFPPERLEFEITETYLLRRPDAAERVINNLRQHGIRIALDDFGTGYASIGYLRRFELDLVKLDRSFVEPVARDAQAADVALAMIALGGALKLPILAEGVETKSQATVLGAAGCKYMQGWFYGKPTSAAYVNGWLAEKNGRDTQAST